MDLQDAFYQGMVECSAASTPVKRLLLHDIHRLVRRVCGSVASRTLQLTTHAYQ